MRKNGQGSSHAISSVFIFLLIGIFALTALALTLIGTRVYSRVTRMAAVNSDSQLVLSYLCNKVHTYDHVGGIALDERGDLPVLCLREELEGSRYETLIYQYDGAMWECFQDADTSFDPEDGQRLTDTQSLTFEQVSPSLIKVTVALADGQTRSLHMAMRAASE